MGVYRENYAMGREVAKILPMEPVYNLKRRSYAFVAERTMKGLQRQTQVFSSGYHGVCLALDLCEHIDIYGFDAPNKKGKSPGAYHLESPYDQCPKGEDGTCQ